jgi:WD40 repeat protein
LKYKRCKCSHTRDVVTLDINNENQCVTGSVDNIICFWNSFNGVESKKIEIPEEIASLNKGQFIQHVKFPFPNKKDLLLVIINNGECYMLET